MNLFFKKKILKLKIILIGGGLVLLFVVGLLCAAKHSPLSILMDTNEKKVTSNGVQREEYGIDVIAEQLLNYYRDFNKEVTKHLREENYIITYEGTNNILDIVKLYAVQIPVDEDPADFSVSAHNKKLKEVFDAMVYSETSTHEEERTEEYTATVIKFDPKTKESITVEEQRTRTYTVTITEIKVYYLTQEQYLQNVTLTEEQEDFLWELNDTYADTYYTDYLKDIGNLPSASSSQTSIQGQIAGICEPLTLSRQEFIDKIGTAAVTSYQQYGILPSLTIAQAILESGWGKSKLSGYNNFFGMKWREGCGCNYVEMPTNEELSNGSYVTVSAKFRAYDSFEAGIAGRCQFITGYSRYANLIGETNYVAACTKIKEDGYATDSAYTTKLINIIESYNLTYYDNLAINGGM